MEPEPVAAEPEPDSSAERDAHRLRNGVIWTAVLLLLLLGIGLAVPDLRNVLRRASDANLLWLAVGVVLELASCLGYVATVRLILYRGRAREVRQLAWAEMAFGAVVPVGGAGGLAVGAWAMRAWGITWTRIANRSAVIFLLTSTVNVVLLAIVALGLAFGINNGHLGVTYGLIPALVAIGALIFFVALPAVPLPRGRPGIWARIVSVIERLVEWVRDTEDLLLRRDWRLLGAVGYLLFDIAVLWVCLRAVGVSAPVLPLIAGYQIGYMANVLPIPGGVGVLEGGLLGALVLYGLPAAPTAAAVILYHAIALWVPTLGGTLAFTRLRQAVAAGVIELAPPRESDRTALADDGSHGVTA